VDRRDAGEDDVDPGEELRAVVVPAHLVRDRPGERVVVGVERLPRRRHGVEGTGAVRVGPEDAGVRAVGGVLGRATSLLVGADGAWSRIRPLLSAATPGYTGTSFVETYLFDADTRHPAAAKAVGDGALLANVPGKGIQAHRESGGTLHTYVALARPQDWFAGIDFTDADAATARIAREFDGWAPELTALITDGETAPVLRPLNTLPIGHRWDRVAGVTLLGDAAHLSPPNGEGANLAMYDGAELGEAIARHPDDVEAALADYERALFPRAGKAATEAARDFELCFGDDAPHSLIGLLTGQQQPA
jgi:2-polyprenyl-6-methoxyphenol hydroxylase-like FAD-dependent oxidoreductase